VDTFSLHLTKHHIRFGEKWSFWKTAFPGWIRSYKDAAISGASIIQRPGVQALLQDAQAGKFEIVLAEALDRSKYPPAEPGTLVR